MIKTDKKVRIGSELKKMEQEYQEERSEYKFRPQKRDKGFILLPWTYSRSFLPPKIINVYYS